MPIVLFDHARVAVAQVLGDNHQWDAVHHCVTGPGVAELVEADIRLARNGLGVYRPWTRTASSANQRMPWLFGG